MYTYILGNSNLFSYHTHGFIIYSFIHCLTNQSRSPWLHLAMSDYAILYTETTLMTDERKDPDLTSNSILCALYDCHHHFRYLTCTRQTITTHSCSIWMTSWVHRIYDIWHDQSSYPQSTTSSYGVTWYPLGNVCHCSRCCDCVFCV